VVEHHAVAHRNKSAVFGAAVKNVVEQFTADVLVGYFERRAAFDDVSLPDCREREGSTSGDCRWADENRTTADSRLFFAESVDGNRAYTRSGGEDNGRYKKEKKCHAIPAVDEKAENTNLAAESIGWMPERSGMFSPAWQFEPERFFVKHF
jgi:hypothetical protein